MVAGDCIAEAFGCLWMRYGIFLGWAIASEGCNSIESVYMLHAEGYGHYYRDSFADTRSGSDNVFRYSHVDHLF